MALSKIFLLLGCLLCLRLIPNQRLQKYGLLVLSVISVFYLQPALPIRYLDFWFPCATIYLTLLCWIITRQHEQNINKPTLLLIVGSTCLLALTRWLSFDGILTASRPPQTLDFAIFTLIWAGLCFGLDKLTMRAAKATMGTLIVLLISLLLVLKTPVLARGSAFLLRSSAHQSADMAAASDLQWLGISYIIFRLLSVLIDSRKGRKFGLNADDFLIYVCFPPTLSAGPIDRPERFSKDINQPKNAQGQLDSDLSKALERFGVGLFKKFILADSLAKLALNPQNATQFLSGSWAWVALFAYGLQLYFDFSGYSDIAIGLARITGLQLPENFNHPYLKPDIAKFWNNWHMTLTQWIRAYVFNPLTRKLRSQKEHPVPQWLIILLTQMTTMLLIGLWHGVTFNFVIWGVWHGLGLFIHQIYARTSTAILNEWQTARPVLWRVYTLFSTLLTILFVMLSWVWFVLPDVSSACDFFGVLF